MYFFRTFKKSTAPYKVHNMGLRYIKDPKLQYFEFIHLCVSRKSRDFGSPPCRQKFSQNILTSPSRLISPTSSTHAHIYSFSITTCILLFSFTKFTYKKRSERKSLHKGAHALTSSLLKWLHLCSSSLYTCRI